MLKDIRQLRLSDIFGEDWDRADSEIGSDTSSVSEDRGDVFSTNSARENVTFFSLLKARKRGQKGVQRSTRRLGILLNWAISCSVVMALVAVGLAGFLLSTMYWNSKTVALQMWSSVLVIIVSCFAVMLNVTGYVGVIHRNRPLLAMYAFYVGIVAIVFFAVFVSCMLYMADVTAITNQARVLLGPSMTS